MASFRVSSNCFLFALSVAGCSVPSSSPPPPSSRAENDDALSEAHRRLPAGLFKLSGTDVNADDRELAPLADFASRYSIVGLGEAAHTSGGFHAMRLRVIEYLVTKHGFRTVMLETPMIDAEPATRFVESGEGTIEAAISSVFDVFASTQQKELFFFLSQWNKSHPDDKVHFYGMDMQEPWAQAKALRSYLSTAMPAKVDALMAPLVASCVGAKYDSESSFYSSAEGQALMNHTQFVDTPSRTACLAGVRSVQNALANLGCSASGAVDPNLARACMAAPALAAWEDEAYYLFGTADVANMAKGLEARDENMAAHVQALHARGGGKSIVVAADIHLSMRMSETNAWKSMGEFLSAAVPDAYGPIALTARKIEINFGKYPQPAEAPPESMEAVLFPYAEFSFLDFERQSQDSPLFATDEAFLMCLPEDHWQAVPAHQYRGVLFLRDSPPMVYAQ